jgi:pyroglutamyl-peptidase
VRGVVLVTGFEPFGGAVVNPSGLIAEELAGRVIAGLSVRAGVLPVARGESGRRVVELIGQWDPQAVVSFGQGGPRQTAVRIERLGVNLRAPRVLDGLGHQPDAEPVMPGMPAAYFATLPVTVIRDRVRRAGVPCELSSSAGTFLCNEVLFTVLHHLATRVPAPPAGFVHVPMLPEQVASFDRPGPSMALETMLRGAEAVIAATAEVLPPEPTLRPAVPAESGGVPRARR